jgi:predicted MPP superfamily phosphohydrolase
VALPAFGLAAYLLLSRVFFTAVRIDYDAGTLLLPAALVAGAAWGWGASRRGIRSRRLRIAIAIDLAAALGLAGLRVWATHIEPHCLQVRTVRIESAKITRPLRILHFSDVQSDRVGDYEARVFAQIVDLHPDLVINTGDFLQPRRPTAAKYREGILALNALVATLHPPLGVLGVAGNVDPPILENPAMPTLEGIRLLNDETADLDWGGAHIRLLGLTMRSSWGEGKDLVENWMAERASGDFTIVLGHAPDYVPLVATQPIDLCLAGHTHGGQVRLPFIGAVATLSHLPRGLVLGYHALGATHLNVSGGVGCEHAAGLPDLRFNCPPEMTLFEIVPVAVARTQ